MNTQTTEQTSVADRSTEFVPVSGGEETSSAGGLLVAAYILMWAFVFGLVWTSFRKAATLKARLTELESALGKVEQDQKHS